MRKFKTESKKLLDLMINSIYTNREIFLRELISNASDAVDKLYFKSLTDKSIQLSKDELAIQVSFDKDARTVTVSDSGIGMTKDELDRNLGTIAHSDSMAFKMENDEVQGDDVDIIGQFGVGFYSSFMVGKSVRVVSKAYGSDEAWAWESDGVEGYTIEPAERAEHGTDVIITLKDNTDDDNYDAYLSEYGLKDLVKRYSNYVRYPIRMEVTKSRELPKPEDAGDDYVPQFENYTELDTVNSMIPIWKRRKSEVEQEEYDEFYKTDFHDFADPARTISVHAEGALSYDALLFVPSRAPFDLYSKDYQKGLALYSSNVLIMEKCEELLPDYYNFVRGVVDSQDLQLNISRETLQHNSQLRAIAKKIEKKITSDLEDMRDNDREGYEAFFENFGRGLKYGIYASYGAQKDTLADLLLYYSAKQDKLVTLAEYVEGMPADQPAIYYAAGDSVERLNKMPIVKTVLGKGYDVLLCTQDVDEFCFTAMRDYGANEDGEGAKELKNVASGDLDFATEDEKKEAEEATKENEDLFKALKDALGDEVCKVAVSARLTDAPACVTTEGPVSLEMERVLSKGPEGPDGVKSQRVLELNAKHPVFDTLKAAHEAGDTDKVRLYADLLYNQALLVEGMPIDDPVAFAQNVAKLM
ncbi:molecular chaperone HtpG [Gordonibacter massiliensis (ex Traore et al. 2017)]|uniref:Chaperone protein HtpG n=1 Tax=Gordonibacter massiliensis (ex Traore et al. 2017) TaxID=1841863 RepID=A0A842J7N0_9ACTN|nr:molecular chaperone HtpG [Gordonibacter massiliensis (ex Traore et al. 2017)]MBC2887803.1 molecular chaperone HtpG [Gordonibacter massiliensis (ex Traore et al. 2017)]